MSYHGAQMEKLTQIINTQFALLKAKDEKIAVLESTINDLTIQANDTEQYNRKCNIRISGLDVPQDASPTAAVLAFFSEKLQVVLKESDICVAHFISAGRFQRKHKTPVILVRFVRSSDKFRIIKERRTLKGSSIAISEDMTRRNLTLLNRVKNTPGVEQSWFSNGHVWCMRGGVKMKIGLFQNIGDAEDGDGAHGQIPRTPPLNTEQRRNRSGRKDTPQPGTSTPRSVEFR